MIRTSSHHGFSLQAWEFAKEEARKAMIERAEAEGTIAYSDLVKRITSIRLEAHDPRLAHLLGEISSQEDAAGRGMLTVVVVRKNGDQKPGAGFFDLAKALGRDVSDKEMLGGRAETS